jgi:parallel beta-helix repeat protein
VFHSGEGPNSVLAGITITRFSAPDELIWDEDEPMPAGGGIFCENSSPTITRCVITDNWAHHLGAGGFGGNICCKGACSPTITHCTISKGVSYFGAGGIYCPGGNPTIMHCIITDNYAVFGVGGADCGSGAMISHCLISNNSGGSGGIEGSPTISSSVITHNRADWQGGGISGSPRIDHCIVSNNVTSPGLGGGIYLTSSAAVIKNCTISGNLAASGYMMGEWWTDGEGGGIFCREGNPTIIQCTIADNTAGARSGGIYGNPSIANCILWENTAPDEPEISGDPNVSFTDVEGGWPGAGNINDDPWFADRDANDFHLKSQAGRWDANEGRWTIDDVTSPCIDAGDPMSPIGQEPFPNGGVINMGTYGGTMEASKSYFGEPLCETIVAGDVNGDCKVNFLDFRLMALHWIEAR